jgi:ABC-type arginine/histidine transport system permease subunit
MKNIITRILNSTFFIFTHVVCTIFLGLLIPMLISTFLVIFGVCKYADCIETVPFWTFAITGFIISFFLLHDSFE